MEFPIPKNKLLFLKGTYSSRFAQNLRNISKTYLFINSYDFIFLQNDVELYHLTTQVREDGPHSFIGIGPNKGKFESSDLPSGCAANFGAPKEASPFIQVFLPPNMKCHGKKLRSVSFTSGASSGARSNVRDKDAAIRSALAWA